MSQPVIGIIACHRQVNGETAQAVMNRYVIAALEQAAVSGLIVPALPDLVDARSVVARLDGLLLTGSPSNVMPERYGDASSGDGPFDGARDEMSARLLEAATDRRIPVFGICRGLQELNVLLGGTLRRDVSVDGAALPHHAPADAALEEVFGHRHPVSLTPDGLFASLYGRDTIDVNSVHYQGIDRLAPGVIVEARAPDGLIEAFRTEINGAPIVAVQWHPEWDAGHDPESQAYFTMFGRAVRGLPLIDSSNSHAC